MIAMAASSFPPEPVSGKIIHVISSVLDKYITDSSGYYLVGKSIVLHYNIQVCLLTLKKINCSAYFIYGFLSGLTYN